MRSIIKGVEQIAYEAKKSNKTEALDKRIMLVMDTLEAHEVLFIIEELLDNRMVQFRKDYADVFMEIRRREEGGETRNCYVITQEIGSNKEEREKTKWLLSVIFDNKMMKADFYTITPFIASAEVKVPYYDAISELPTIRIVDTVGLNQKKEEVKTQISGYLQKHKPDIVLYHTRLDQKDDTLISNLEFNNSLGYGKRTRVVYGRFDHFLEKYYEEAYPEEREHLPKMAADEFDIKGFLVHLEQEYLKSDRQTLSKIVGDDNIYLCDKKQTYPVLLKYSPEYIMQMIASNWKVEEKFRFPDGFKDSFIRCLYRTNLIKIFKRLFSTKPLIIMMTSLESFLRHYQNWLSSI